MPGRPGPLGDQAPKERPRGGGGSGRHPGPPKEGRPSRRLVCGISPVTADRISLFAARRAVEPTRRRAAQGDDWASGDREV